MRTNTCAVHRTHLQTETSPLSYDRKSGAFTGSILITNVSGQVIVGPLTVLVTDLMPLAVLENASGLHGRDPFIHVPLPCDNLLPGGSVTVPVTFRKRSLLALGAIRYRVKTHCGEFKPKLEREKAGAPSHLEGSGNDGDRSGKREKKEGNKEAVVRAIIPPVVEVREEKPQEALSLPGFALVRSHQDANGPARQEVVVPVRCPDSIGRRIGYDQVVMSRSGDI